MARKLRAQGYGTRGVGTGNGATAAAAGGDGTARPWLDAGRSTPVSLRALRHSSRHEWLVAGCLLTLLALVARALPGGRSEERRGGEGVVSTCICRGGRY